MGKLVVIEGLDGSGKATQTALLAERLAARGQLARMVSFPDYKSHSSALVRMYLGGEFGSDPMAVNAYAASAFYAVDRFASFAKDWGAFYREGGTVLADRYTTSNAIHQCAKLPRGEWAGYTAWLEDFEYAKLGIPKPDLVICLDVDPLVSQKLLAARYGGEEKRDIHEQDIAYLQACRTAAHWCAGHLGWVTVACSRDGGMRPIGEISADIDSIIQKDLLPEEQL